MIPVFFSCASGLQVIVGLGCAGLGVCSPVFTSPLGIIRADEDGSLSLGDPYQ